MNASANHEELRAKIKERRRIDGFILLRENAFVKIDVLVERCQSFDGRSADGDPMASGNSKTPANPLSDYAYSPAANLLAACFFNDAQTATV